MSKEAPGRIGRFLQRVDKDPRLVKLLRLGRSRLPGDERYGDPLSLTGDQAPAVLGRRLSALTAEQPGALREVGMSALQVWQGLSEAQGRGSGDRELAIVFTDLADFSTWALDAGDTQAVALLREVGSAIEPEICSRGGEIVKRLGDGLMAVFEGRRPRDRGRPRVGPGVKGAEAAAGDDPWGAFIGFMERIADAYCEDRGMVSSMSQAIELDELLQARADAHDALRELIERAIAQGSMRADAQPADLKVLLSGIARTLAAEQERDPAVWRHYARLVVDALRAQN